MFYVGQKVVCVNAKFNAFAVPWSVHPKATMDGLTEGAIYTIRSAGLYRGVYLVWLEEILREKIGDDLRHGEVGYDPRRFRPIQERKTDISVFEEILRKHSSPADQRKFETASAVGS